MGFLTRFFQRAETAPLPTLEALFEARGVPLDLAGLEVFLPDFEHLHAEERVHWADAVAELHRATHALPMPWLDAQHELMPQVVPTWQAQREGFWFRPALDGLSERILVAGQPMPEPWLALWGVRAEDVAERALDALRERSKDKAFLRLPTGIYQSRFGDGLDASRILLPELWEHTFPGQNHFVALPAQDVLLVSPQVLLPKLVEAVGRVLAETGSRVMGTLYQRVGANILPASMQDPHPIAQPQRDLRQGDLMAAYQAQEAELPAELGVAAPVGSLRTQQGRSLSFTLWKEGSPVLLPETDLVGFVAEDGRPLGLYARQSLPRIARLRGQAVDIWGPRRTRHEGFPEARELELLECFATAEQMAGIFKSEKPTRPAPPPAANTLTGAYGSQGSV